MKIKLLFIVLGIFITVSCDSQNVNNESMLAEITKKEQSIKQISIDLRPGQVIPMSESDELVELLLAYYHASPESVEAPLCLDKIHMIYSSTKRYSLSVNYGDTLLNQYPDYINRAMIIESMAVTYDIFIHPRNKDKVRFYNEMLLTENPDLPEEKQAEIKFKLENLDLTLEEMIRKSNQ